ncbi:CbtB domain-containing protein [Alkalimarinus sediminis]|uniref:CbtB-domain containing protein n=1 Tax=Alkalimarinus sediminis TaxID=1632866 RepID=A0A9E8HIE1_9ALTE|nr:CbtB domain-containing protein [Alkalimarinus sediminis]UZW74979.1 CbtB-domain containing protein [Alkalimarinus sediminis]
MNTHVSGPQTPANQAAAKAASLTASKRSQIFAAAFLGLTIVFAVGLLPMDAAHNAAHDTRHSAAFPCH